MKAQDTLDLVRTFCALVPKEILTDVMTHICRSLRVKQVEEYCLMVKNEGNVIKLQLLGQDQQLFEAMNEVSHLFELTMTLESLVNR